MDSNTVQKLRQVPLFSAIGDEGLARIAAVGTEFEASAGQVLTELGHPGTGCFLIEEGTVRVDPPHSDSLERGPGDFFGELAVLTDSTRTARVTAATDVRCLAIRRDDMMRLLTEEPGIALAMLKQIAARLAEAI